MTSGYLPVAEDGRDEPEVHPFVPHAPFVDTSRGADDVRAECRRLAREGANALHARAAGTAKTKTLTDAESAAIARKKLEDQP